MTDVYMQPRREQEFDRTYAVQQPAGDMAVLGSGNQQQSYDRSFEQQTEMAAFEKGRMQGEMEAIRRMEAEAPLKTMAAPIDQSATLTRPDVLEINRLTNLQRASWVLGELAGLTFVACAIAWMVRYHDGFGFGHNGDEVGMRSHFNVGMLTFALGLFIHAQAISNYRVLPINFSATANRMWYILLQACTMTCYAITLATVIMSSPEATFWSVTEWCFALALAIYVPHAFYSMFRAATERMRPVDYETWAEVNNRLEAEPQRGHIGGQGRTTKAHGGAGLTHDNPLRTIYTEAPAYVPRLSASVPPANANVGAQVPVAPANAPRWAETPKTHAEDYFLLARSKWAVTGFFAMGTAFLMFISHTQHNIAAGMYNWSQDSGLYSGVDANGVPNNSIPGQFDETGRQAHLMSVTGLMVLACLIFISYASMPPRTVLVKNGAAPVDARRGSISHNAETRLGHNAV